MLHCWRAGGPARGRCRDLRYCGVGEFSSFFLSSAVFALAIHPFGLQVRPPSKDSHRSQPALASVWREGRRRSYPPRTASQGGLWDVPTAPPRLGRRGGAVPALGQRRRCTADTLGQRSARASCYGARGVRQPDAAAVAAGAQPGRVPDAGDLGCGGRVAVGIAPAIPRPPGAPPKQPAHRSGEKAETPGPAPAIGAGRAPGAARGAPRVARVRDGSAPLAAPRARRLRQARPAACAAGI